jgi:aspartyl-tRNA(Asn)/glutamyl-tRNA(Gln) amidotransferase subunit A
VADTKPTVLGLAADLAIGHTTSRALIEAALAPIADAVGEGQRTYRKVYADQARAAADAQDRLRKAGYVDVDPDQTLAGSKALDDRSPARDDAPTRCAG